MKKILFLSLFTCALYAHTPLLTCMDEGDGSVTCEGGFSDGSSAGGVKFRVEQNGTVLINTKFNSTSEVNFKKPNGEYTAIFDAGAEHIVYLKSDKIFE